MIDCREEMGVNLYHPPLSRLCIKLRRAKRKGENNEEDYNRDVAISEFNACNEEQNPSTRLILRTRHRLSILVLAVKMKTSMDVVEIDRR